MATLTRLSAHRAAICLNLARQLAQRVTFRKVDGFETGDVEGSPQTLAALCQYLGAGAPRPGRRWVWLAPKYRARLRTLMRGAVEAEEEAA